MEPGTRFQKFSNRSNRFRDWFQNFWNRRDRGQFQKFGPGTRSCSPLIGDSRLSLNLGRRLSQKRSLENLVLKSKRRTKAHRVPKHKGQGAWRRHTHYECEAHFYTKTFKSPSHFTKYILQIQVT